MEKTDGSPIEKNNHIILPQGVKIEGVYHQFDFLPLTMVALVLQSAFIPNNKILSLLLISNPSLGKTSYLQPLQTLDYVHYTNDFTSKPLQQFIDSVHNGKKKFLVSPDFTSSLGHSKHTIANTRATLRALIEEGYSGVDVYGMDNKKYNPPVKCGLITAITTESYMENKNLWRKDGFLSRFIPFSYSHSIETRDVIAHEKTKSIKSLYDVQFMINKNPKTPTIPENLHDKIKLIAYSTVGDLKYIGAEYRPLDHVISLCISSAVMRNSDTIEEFDIEIVKRLAQYINRNGNPL